MQPQPNPHTGQTPSPGTAASIIRFYSPREVPYGCFSNFSAHGFKLDGLWYPTNEHYFQAQKFAGLLYAEHIRTASTPKQAATLGRSREVVLRADWEAVKEAVMLTGLRAKFTAHTDIQIVLLSTGQVPLVEASLIDAYWGCGKDGRGLNRLGYLLMELRTELKAVSQQPTPRR